MNIELINTGSELMLGRVLNTHQQWLCRQLADQGYVVTRQVAVPDTAAAITEAVREALSRADLVITTGGLGPTSDDLTRDEVARLLGRSLHEDPAVLAHIRHFFESRRRPMPERTRVQAMIPAGAQVLFNPHGTAPGLAMEVKSGSHGRPAYLIMLPGPTRELRPMFTDKVVPLIKQRLPLEGDFICRTLRTTGIGESMVEEQVHTPLQPLVAAGVQVGYCARPGQVDVRLSAVGPDAGQRVEAAEAIVRKLLGPYIYTAEDEELEAAIIQLLTQRHETLAVAESCTGGCIAHRLTNVPGASAVLMAGWVTYSNEAKQSCLGVRAETLAQHGAVSEEVAREMAEGARQQAKVDYALSVTGIAGPGGGTPQKPVGTVFIGLTSAAGTVVKRYPNAFDRETFKQVTTQQALELLRRRVTRSDEPIT